MPRVQHITVRKHLNIIKKNERIYRRDLESQANFYRQVTIELKEAQSQLKKQQEIWHIEEASYGNRITNLCRNNEVLEQQIVNLEKIMEVIGGVLRKNAIDYERLRQEVKLYRNTESTNAIMEENFTNYEISSRNRY